MSDDSAPGALDGLKSRRKVVFDPTINLGHVLTFAGMLAALASVYVTIRGELTAHEVRISAMDRAAEVEKERIRDDVRMIRDDVRDVRRGIDELRRQNGPKLQ